MSRFSIEGEGGSAPDEYVPVNNHNEVPELESRIDLVASEAPKIPTDEPRKTTLEPPAKRRIDTSMYKPVKPKEYENPWNAKLKV